MTISERYRGKGGEIYILLLTCAGLMLNLLELFDHRGVFEILACFVFALFVIILYHLLIGGPPTPIPPGERFPGVGRPLGEGSLVVRHSEKERIKHGILNPPSAQVSVITGKSGAGKSELIRLAAQELRSGGWTVRVVDKYDHLGTTLRELFSPSDEQGGPVRTILILDQAEQLSVARISDNDRTWLHDRLLESLRSTSFRCAFVVREDYYISLKFLEDLLPPLTKVIQIRGLANDPIHETYESMREKVQRFCSDQLTDQVLADLEGVNGVSPLEFQMVGFVLERKQPIERMELETYRQLGGKPGLIKEYFMLHVAACRSRDAALAVLFALSTGTLRDSILFGELRQLTYYSKEEIEDVLKVFLDAKLVIRPEASDRYQWAHDILPERFREISAADMEPGLRDNLTSLAGVKPINPSSILSVKDKTYRWRNRVMLAGLIVVGILLTATKAGIGWQDIKMGYLPSIEFDEARRAAYPLFAFGSALLWGLFLYRMRWLYIRPSTTSGGVSWWVAMPVTGVLSACGTWLWPSSWLLWIGTTAGVLGAGLLVTPWGRNLSKQSARKFRAFGLDCVYFAVFVCLTLGLVNVRFGDTLRMAVGTDQFNVWLNYQGAVLSVVAIGAMYDKTNASVLTMYLGFLDRTNGTYSGRGAGPAAKV